MSLGEDHISQPSGIGKSLVQIALKSFSREKSLSVNRSSTVDSAIPTPDTTSIFATVIPMRDIHQMLLILTKVSWSSKREQSGYYSRISTSHWFLQYPHYPHQQVTISTVPPIRKSKGTSYYSINSKSFTVHSNHSESLLLSVETVFTPSKSKLLSAISAVFQQHPMLPPAYLREPMLQSSAGLKLLPSQQKSVRGFISCSSLIQQK